MTTETDPRRPTHEIFQVTGEAERSSWTRIGAAWPNRDGKGFSLKLEAVPLAGRIVMRAIETPAEPDTTG